MRCWERLSLGVLVRSDYRNGEDAAEETSRAYYGITTVPSLSGDSTIKSKLILQVWPCAQNPINSFCPDYTSIRIKLQIAPFRHTPILQSRVWRLHTVSQEKSYLWFSSTRTEHGAGRLLRPLSDRLLYIWSDIVDYIHPHEITTWVNTRLKLRMP